MAAFTIRIPNDINEKIEIVSKEKGLTKNAYINLVLSEKVKRDEKNLREEKNEQR